MREEDSEQAFGPPSPYSMKGTERTAGSFEISLTLC
jgi:hypothetical protein